MYEERSPQWWIAEIEAARKREESWRKDAERIIRIYESRDDGKVPFNILFSNTETMLPALYSSVPRPVVRRRFKDDDPIGRAAATAAQRMLEFMLDTNIEGYETFDTAIKTSTLHALLVGRGVATVKYDSEEDTLPGDEPVPYKKFELVCLESKLWNRVYFGFAHKWTKVPWIAYEEYIDKEEATRLFGKEIAEKLNYSGSEQEDSEDKSLKPYGDVVGRAERRLALVYQIWDKDGGRRVLYVSPSMPDRFLLEMDDPLQLTGFFNCPQPMEFIERASGGSPVPIYSLYEQQAVEINEITRRIRNVVRAIKARGIYDTELGEDIKRLFEADDNELVPAEKSSAFSAERGLQNAIWFAPLQELITTLEKLYAAREQCKRVIYEVTGISDILRGMSVASETATAQRIKSEWGSLRFRRKQYEVQRFARDMLRLMVEVAAARFSEDTWARMTGLPYLTEQDFAREQMVVEQLTALLASGQASPQVQQQLEQARRNLTTPRWSQVLDILRNDLHRAYRVDIETNSTVDPEAVEDQRHISEVMTALGQFLNGVTPLVTSGTMPFQAAQAMMLAITRRFRFGEEIEDYIKAMQPPQPPDAGKEAMADIEREKTRLAMEQAQLEAEKRDLAAQRELAMKDIEIARLRAELSAADMKVKETVSNIELQARERMVRESEAVVAAKAQQVARNEQRNDAASAKAIAAIHRLVTTFAETMAQLVARLEQSDANLSDKMAQILAISSAPRRSRAIRGKDGRIEETVSEPVLAQTTQTTNLQ
jgi:hypothetical protein